MVCQIYKIENVAFSRHTLLRYSAMNPNNIAEFEALREGIAGIDGERLDLLLAAAPFLSETMLPRCLALALDLYDVPEQGELIQVLAQRIGEASAGCQKQALEAIRATDLISDISSSADFLTALVPFLPQELLPMATQSALIAGQRDVRLPLLATLSQRIYHEDLPSLTSLILDKAHKEIEAEVYKPSDDYSGSMWQHHAEETLRGLSAHLPPEQRESALWIARMLDPGSKTLVLLRMALDWGWEQNRSLEVEAFHSWRYRSGYIDGHLLRDLILELPSEPRAVWVAHLWRELFVYSYRRDENTEDDLRQQVWPLLISQQRDEWLSQKLEAIAQLPEQRKRWVEYFDQEELEFPRADAIRKLAPFVSLERFDEALGIIETLPTAESRLEALKAFDSRPLFAGKAYFGESKLYVVPLSRLQFHIEAACSDIRKEMDIFGAPPVEVIKILLDHAHFSEGALREQLVRQAWQHFRDNKAQLINFGSEGVELSPFERCDASELLEKFYYYAPIDLLSEVIELVLQCPPNFRERTSNGALRPLAQRWPDGLLLLLESVSDDVLQGWTFERAWSFLPREVKDALSPRIESRIYANIVKAEIDEPLTTLESTEETLFDASGLGLLPELARREVLRFILSFPSSLKRGHLLQEILEDLPGTVRSDAARVAWDDLRIQNGPDEDFKWKHPNFYSWVSLLRFLPDDEQNKGAASLLEEILDGTTRIPSEPSSAETSSEGDGDFAYTESPWSNALSALKGLVLHLDEAHLRRLVTFLREENITLDQKLLKWQGELWPREQLLVQVLMALARAISLKYGFNEEVQQLSRESLRLTFIYPYFPELGGDGGDQEELPSSLSAEQLIVGIRNCSPEERQALLGQMMHIMSERTDARVVHALDNEENKRSAGLSTLEGPRPLAELYLRGQFPAQVRLGETHALRVRVSPHHLRGDGVLQGVEMSPQGARLLLLLDAPDFEARSPLQMEVQVSPDGDSDWVEFALRTRSRGRVQLGVSVFQNGAYIGHLAVRSEVVDNVCASALPEWAASFESAPPVEGAVTWCLSPDRQTGTISHFLTAWNGGNWRGEEIPVRSTGESLEQLIERIPDKVDTFSHSILVGHGLDLWRECVPAEIQHALTELMPQMRQLTILTADDPRPWEMLCSREFPAHKGEFLSEFLPICRWKWGSPPPKQLSWQNPYFVFTKQTTPTCMTELSDVKRLTGAYREEVLPPFRELEPLMTHLAKGEFDWLHLTGHHNFDPTLPSTSTFSLQDGRFQPVLLATLEDRWNGRMPFVFLNACQTAGSALSYSACDGWAQRCLRAGAGAFAGTQWEVRNDVSHHFAVAFYERLAAQMPIGKAFFEARLSTRDLNADYSWLAYALYGNAQAQVVPVVSLG